MSAFDAKKAKILHQLDAPDGEYQDLSPKGSVDDNIRELVAEINLLNGFVTTSSCGGRIAVYLEGPPQTGSGGKGGGRWLFTTHRPLELSDLADEGLVFDTLGLPKGSAVCAPSHSGGVRFIHFKFEPMILHILTSSPANAQRALSAALDAGFRESGISGIASTGQRPVTPMVAVRSSGLAFDCIIGYHDPASDAVKPMVSEDYLRSLIGLANERFATNDSRKDRFHRALVARSASERATVANGESITGA